MRDIPDELRVELAKDYVRQNFESGEPWSMTIARAILDERERCAFAVETHSGFGDPATIEACVEIIRAPSRATAE